MSEIAVSVRPEVEALGKSVTRNQIPGIVEKITGVRPSPSAAYRLVRNGKIPAFRLTEGGQLFARRADVEAYARKQLAAGVAIRGRQAAEALDRIQRGAERGGKAVAR